MVFDRTQPPLSGHCYTNRPYTVHFCIAHVHVPIVGVGKERRTKNAPWCYLNSQYPLLELPWGLQALCRRILGSERHWYTIAWLDKLGTDPMAVDGMSGRRCGRREEGKESVSKHLPIKFSPGVDNERAGAGRDGWTCLARPNSQARMGCSSDHQQDCQPYRLMPNLLLRRICNDYTERGTYWLVHGDLPKQHSFGTTLRFTGPVPADSRQWTPSVRNCVTR